MSMLKRFVKKFIWIIRGGYKPQKFWEQWAETFDDDPWQKEIHPQHTWLLKKIKESNPKSILEIGCGFGRNIVFLLDQGIAPQKISGVDISKKMIKHAATYIKNKKVELLSANVLDLPFSDRAFDTTFAHGLFMHVQPKDVQQAIKETMRVTKNTIICVEQNYLIDGDKSSDYTFLHNYKQLFTKNGGIIKEYRSNKKLGLDYILITK